MARITAVPQPSDMGTAPDAIGRSRFLGWNRSFSLSRMSLAIYMALLRDENRINAIVVSLTKDNDLDTSTGSHSSLIVKNSAKYTKRFLVHCLGRAEIRSALDTLTTLEMGVCSAGNFMP